LFSLGLGIAQKLYVLSFKFELTAKKGSANLPSLIDRKLSLID